MRFAFGEYELNEDDRTLEHRGEKVWVEPRVFDLLAYLIRHRERFVPPDELLDAIWPGTCVGPAALSQAIHKARHAVGDDGIHQQVLRTEHGHGYRFVTKVLVAYSPMGVAPVSRGFRAGSIAIGAVAALLLSIAAAWLANRPLGKVAPPNSLAVLPFVNMSGDPDQDFLGYRIADDLLHSLARLEGLQVVARTSSFSFDESNADVKSIGEALNVELIVEGSIRMTGERLRLAVQLVDAQDGFHRWAEIYHCEREELPAVQEEIARSLARVLQVDTDSAQDQ